MAVASRRWLQTSRGCVEAASWRPHRGLSAPGKQPDMRHHRATVRVMVQYATSQTACRRGRSHPGNRRPSCMALEQVGHALGLFGIQRHVSCWAPNKCHFFVWLILHRRNWTSEIEVVASWSSGRRSVRLLPPGDRNYG
jgi:hypothetical protein